MSSVVSIGPTDCGPRHVTLISRIEPVRVLATTPPTTLFLGLVADTSIVRAPLGDGS
jgi:hypothetical protein